MQTQNINCIINQNQQKMFERLSINIQNRFRHKIFLLCLIIILITLIFNAIFSNSLYKQGINMIYTSQQNLQGSLYIIVNNLLSLFCHPVTVGIVVFAQLVLVKHKLKVFVHICFFMSCIYIMAFMKQLYQQSRPAWSSTLIHKFQWFCPTDFGNPSGHSFAVFPLYQPIISKYIGFQNFKSAWIFFISFGILVPFSRTYLGVHSVNQVVFGLVLGLVSTVLYRYKIRELLYILFSKLLKQKPYALIKMLFCLHILCIILPWICFIAYSIQNQINQQDINNLNQICSCNLSSLEMQKSMLTKCTAQSFVFGILYGMIMMDYNSKDRDYFVGKYQYNTNTLMVLHHATMVIIPTIIVVTFAVVATLLSSSSTFAYLAGNVGLTLAGFTLIYLTPKIQRKFQWISYSESQTQRLNQKKSQQISKFNY